MKFEEALKKAEETAFKDYGNECKRLKCDKGYNAKRTWDKTVYEKYTVYSLSGTPPKAYVVVHPESKKIFCKRTFSAEAFKIFDFEDEPSGSPSVSGVLV
jgi:hypothetical protein